MIIIDLIRHAESEWVKEADAAPVPLFGGRMLHVGLSAAGANDALRLDKYAHEKGIRPSVVYTSPALRARRTAELSTVMVRPTPRILVRDGLVELTWGDWERQPRSIRDNSPFREQRQRQGLAFTPPGGESFLTVQQRAMAELRKIVQEVDKTYVWVVTHNNVIKSIVQPFVGWSLPQVEQAKVHVLSFTRLTYDEGVFRLAFFNKRYI